MYTTEYKVSVAKFYFTRNFSPIVEKRVDLKGQFDLTLPVQKQLGGVLRSFKPSTDISCCADELRSALWSAQTLRGPQP